jgi:superfamily II DNA or RNA helicase
MYLYVASSPAWQSKNLFKIGLTEDPLNRYHLTGYPPGQDPCAGIKVILVWKINVNTTEELRYQEEIFHTEYEKHRLMWEIPGDSEWFAFPFNPIDLFRSFATRQGWNEVRIEMILPNRKESRFLKKQYNKNRWFIKNKADRIKKLCQLQEPIIAKIKEFLRDPQKRAGYGFAPCGFGKTRITSEAIKDLKKLLLTCPSKKIQKQWVDTFIKVGAFDREQIYLIGDNGTTDPNKIKKYTEKDVFCLISTYQSSYLLKPYLTDEIDLLIGDEAHHLAGKVLKENEVEGQGITRQLFQEAAKKGIKRFCLTFTPRYISNPSDLDCDYLSMDDSVIFGEEIFNINLRLVIEAGILPDYRIWALWDKMNKADGIAAKIDYILEAWQSKEIIRHEERYMLNHLIIFTRSIAEAEEAECILKQKFNESGDTTLVVSAGSKIDFTNEITKFEAASRSIIVNCRILGEGVDIPCADSVAILYPKRSITDIVQMLLRPGRWYENKPLFHIILPILDGEDFDGFERALVALASHDNAIFEEVILKLNKKSEESDPSTNTFMNESVKPEMIDISLFDGADMIKMTETLSRARTALTPAAVNREKILKMCREKSIRTSREYKALHAEMPDLPESLLRGEETWFGLLNPNIETIKTSDWIAKCIKPNNINIAEQYESWFLAQAELVVPSLQNINDGYFGSEINFNTLLEKHGVIELSRGRYVALPSNDPIIHL